jgi:hypothetical protein
MQRAWFELERSEDNVFDMSDDAELKMRVLKDKLVYLMPRIYWKF